MKPRVEFDLSILKNNIVKLKNETNNINFLFPVKCCNNPKVLEMIVANNFGFDISNINEFKIIEKYLTNQFVSVSGPLSYELLYCEYHNINIVANNFSSYKENNGLRINFNSNNKFEFSRFGVDYKLVEESIRKKITYIHLHNSDHRDLEKCKYIYEEIKNILTYFPNLNKINIGGHLEDLSFDDGINYLRTMRDLIPKNISLYVELGDFLFKGVGILYGNVVDVRQDNGLQIVTLNFSKMANQRWAYPQYLTSDNDNLIHTIFYGCSCCETDVYLETQSKILNIGDEVKFTNISPYSYQWNTSFNGVKEMEYIFK